MACLNWPALILTAAAALPMGAGAVEYVDLELVLAVDVSRSVDNEEATLQRDGYIAALTSPKVIAAVRSGILGRIAVTYVEWAGTYHTSIVMGWQVIDGEAGAYAFTDALAEMPVSRESFTSITSAIEFAIPLFDNNGIEGTRRVIDVSGDGPNNMGGLVTFARDRAVAQGIIINGLPIINDNDRWRGYSSLVELDLYYTNCVIGGPGAFIIAAADFNSFADAVRRKLVLEIAELAPRPRPRLWRVAERAIPPCDIGERLWQQRRLLRGLR